jgi:hypothetical protein
MVRYVRCESLAPPNESWNRALALSTAPYLCIFHDDDLMEEDFLKVSLQHLAASPSAAFSFTRALCMDGDGEPLGPWYAGEIPAGTISGADYLHLTVAAGRCISLAPTVVYRKAALERLGGFACPHGGDTFDFNLFIRAACEFDVVFVDLPLVRYRIHAGQLTERHWRSVRQTGRVGAMTELVDAVGALLTSPRAGDSNYRGWLSGRLRFFNERRSTMARTLVRDL